MKTITIFTATYNRANTLPRLYESLKRQTSYDFEWIIVDDESKDNTADIVERWIEETKEFNIVYRRQPHGGKHRAINYGLELSNGYYYFIVDSDDYITDNAIQLLVEWIKTVSENKKIGAVAGLRVSADGRIHGGETKIKGEYVDASNFERKRYNLMGDKAEVYKTDLMKAHKFPEFDGEYFVTEDICWLNIAADGYLIRWFNKPIYISDYLEDGLTNNGANSYLGHRTNYKGYCFYVSECIKKKPFVEKMLHLKEFDRFRIGEKIRLNKAAKDIGLSSFKYFFMNVVGVPFGYLLRKTILR